MKVEVVLVRVLLNILDSLRRSHTLGDRDAFIVNNLTHQSPIAAMCVVVSVSAHFLMYPGAGSMPVPLVPQQLMTGGPPQVSPSWLKSVQK
mmetsp:Transcript_29593/g.38201  ORF Transcript_29593/g.38201 Transcript_29593/m.38201 type:complete len:91 (-) Transcript_29593:568-840(-)